MESRQTFRFTVEGTVAGSLLNWFSDMDCSSENDRTIITGEMADQAAVYGMIARIRDLGLTLIKMERII